MSVSPGRRGLSLLYLLFYSGSAGVLILVGFALERLLPAAAADRYRRAMVVALVAIARPVDGLTGGSPEPVAGGVTGESAP